MSDYKLVRDEGSGDGVQRILVSLCGDALEMLAAPDRLGVGPTVHETRKTAKMARGVVRMVRPEIGDAYSEFNAALRDAGRELAPIRDPQSLLGAFDALVASSADSLPDGGVLGIRSVLSDRAEEANDALMDGEAHRIEAASNLIEEARGMVGWQLGDGFGVFQDGLAKTYKRGRKGYERSVKKGKVKSFHEWRKRVKYLWYQTRLLEDSAPAVLSPMISRFHDLSDSLGDAHDLALLEHAVGEMEGPEDEVRAIESLARQVRGDLESRAQRLGARLYVEDPDAFVGRLAGYWSAWEEGPEMEAGEIEDLFPAEDGLDDKPRDELYDEATRLDIPGRSSMRREDLISALRASGTR